MFLLPAALAAPYVPLAEPTFGTAHPILVQRSAPDGRWVAACQARTDTDGDGKIEVHLGMHGEVFGDHARLYLFDVAYPEGDPIDAFVDSDAAGRWIAFTQGGRLLVRDTVTGLDVPFGATNLTDDGDPLASPRAAAISPSGSTVVTLEGADGSERVVVRTLPEGTPRTVDVGAGRVWRAEPLGDTPWIAVGVVPADTNGDGVLGLPSRRTSLAGGTCRGAPMSYSTYGFAGDAFEWRVVHGSDGRVDTRALAATIADTLIVKGTDGALVNVPAEGPETILAPAECKGRVAAVWPEGPAVLVACGANADALRLYDGSWVREIGRAATPAYGGPDEAQIVIVAGDGLVDLATGKVHPQSYAGDAGSLGDRILAVDQSHTVVLKDLGDGTSTPIAGPTKRYVYGWSSGRWAWVSHDEPLIVDLEGGRVVGTVPGEPVALREDGAALVPAVSAQVSTGPLVWYGPAPTP